MLDHCRTPVTGTTSNEVSIDSGGGGVKKKGKETLPATTSQQLLVCSLASKSWLTGWLVACVRSQQDKAT